MDYLFSITQFDRYKAQDKYPCGKAKLFTVQAEEKENTRKIITSVEVFPADRVYYVHGNVLCNLFPKCDE